MIKKMNIEKLTDREWELLASSLSGENESEPDLTGKFVSADKYNTAKQWKETGMMSGEKEINVDKAWDDLNSRLGKPGSPEQNKSVKFSIFRRSLLRIAAAVLLLTGISASFYFLINNDTLSRKVTLVTDNDHKNLKVTLPDGSIISLNRNTELTYRSNFNEPGRRVRLRGEAYFDISPNDSKPFIIDAGNARVKVIGTSFNVRTNNNDSAVEVFVETGVVMLSDNSGRKNLILEPGYVGTFDLKESVKMLNHNPNYMSWNTGLLVYDGQKLDVVFRDLKRVYDMNIVADDPEILNETWTSPIDNQSQETIIRLICASFNLTYTKDGNVYHLKK